MGDYEGLFRRALDHIDFKRKAWEMRAGTWSIVALYAVSKKSGHPRG